MYNLKKLEGSYIKVFLIVVAISLIVIGIFLLFFPNKIKLKDTIYFKSSNSVLFKCKIKLKLSKRKKLHRKEIFRKKAKIIKFIKASLSNINSNDMYSKNLRQSAFLRNNLLRKLNSILTYATIKKVELYYISRASSGASSQSRYSNDEASSSTADRQEAAQSSSVRGGK